MRTRSMAVAAMALVVMAGACSSQTNSSGATTPESSVASTTTQQAASGEPSKDSYIAQASAICSDMNARSAQLSQSTQSGKQTPHAAATMLRGQASIIESTVAKLRALPRPAGDEATLESAYEAADKVPPAGNAVADALDSGNQTEANRLGAIADQLTAAANQAIDAYGAPECGSGSNSTTA